MRLTDFTGHGHDQQGAKSYYRALVTWFRRAGLLEAWINYQQDTDLLIRNFIPDLRLFIDSGRSSPPGTIEELQEFLLWQLPHYNVFEEEGSAAREVLAEVIQLTTSHRLEDALDMLNPKDKKYGLAQLRKAHQQAPHDRSPRRRSGAA